MRKCLLFIVIIILSTYFVIVPKGAIGLFDIKNAVSSPYDNKIELYVTSWCPWCEKAIAFLESRGVQFDVYDIEKDADAAKRKNQLDSKKGVPFALIYGQGIHGFSKEAYDKALNARGGGHKKAKKYKRDKKPKSWQLLHRQ